MRKITSLFFILLLSVLTTSAQNIVQLGYCGGESTTKGSVSVEGKTWVSAAIYLPATTLDNYAGSDITHIRAALASKINLDTVKVWLRSELSGQDITSVTLTNKGEQPFAKGWNDIALPNPYKIAGGQGVYVGISYHQKAAAKALSVVGSATANGFFAKLGDDAQWTDRSSTGALSIEATVEAQSLPDYDVAVLSAYADPYKDATQTKVRAVIMNNGSKPIHGVTLTTKYELDDEAFTSHFDTNIAWGEKDTVEYEIPSKPVVSYGNILVSVESLDDGTDAVADNNSVAARYALQKKVLIEEYTTEPCGNCPRVARYLHEVMDMPQFKDKIIAVCHHAGYKTDWLTKPCDESLVNFFGVGYAPAVSYDRYPYFDGGIYSCPEKAEIIGATQDRLSTDANVSVQISASYDEAAKKLNVSVSGTRGELSMNDPRLTVYVLEDSILAHSQAGANGEYWQMHVIRANNSTYGDEIEWSGNAYEKDYSFDIDETWNTSHMQIVAFVSNYDSKRRSNNVIDNAEAVAFPSVATGIHQATAAGHTTSKEYFTVSGMKVSQPEHGIYIVREHKDNGRIVSYKMMK